MEGWGSGGQSWAELGINKGRAECLPLGLDQAEGPWIHQGEKSKKIMF